MAVSSDGLLKGQPKCAEGTGREQRSRALRVSPHHRERIILSLLTDSQAGRASVGRVELRQVVLRAVEVEVCAARPVVRALELAVLRQVHLDRSRARAREPLARAEEAAAAPV